MPTTKVIYSVHQFCYKTTYMKNLSLSISIVIVTTIQLWAQKSEVFINSGKAIKGYDPVGYFKWNKPVKGADAFIYSWKGANWHFVSHQNLEEFKANPQKYAPQYGGYCAYGLSEGYKAPIDPDAWTIVNNKLYLNYSLKIRDTWNKDRQRRIEVADKNWPTVKGK
jgi:YHS domain-containing protein